jgi:hypothetical protein
MQLEVFSEQICHLQLAVLYCGGCTTFGGAYLSFTTVFGPYSSGRGHFVPYPILKSSLAIVKGQIITK